MSEQGGVSVDRFGQLLQPLLKPAVRVYGEVVSHASERIWVESGESVVFT